MSSVSVCFFVHVSPLLFCRIVQHQGVYQHHHHLFFFHGYLPTRTFSLILVECVPMFYLERKSKICDQNVACILHSTRQDQPVSVLLQSPLQWLAHESSSLIYKNVYHQYMDDLRMPLANRIYSSVVV